jgi:hypothetical protein
MIVTGFPAVTIVGPRDVQLSARSATHPGASNYMVLRDPAVDTLIDGLVQADSREEMVHYARALDRVLQWGYYMIPNYYPPAPRPCGGTASAPGATQVRRRPEHLVGSQPNRPRNRCNAQLKGPVTCCVIISRRLLLIIPTLLCICWSIS